MSINASAVETVFAPVRRDKAGLLVTVVGFDASGKTTQISNLAKRFTDAGRDVLETRQPTDWYRNESFVQTFHFGGGTVEQARIMSLFVAADRQKHCLEVIQPHLNKGGVVICDRYVYATFAVMMHRGLELDFLLTINRGIPKPDHAFYLKVPIPELQRRLRERDRDNLQFEEKSADRIQSIVGCYDRMGEALVTVDGFRDERAVTDDLWDRIGHG